MEAPQDALTKRLSLCRRWPDADRVFTGRLLSLCGAAREQWQLVLGSSDCIWCARNLGHHSQTLCSFLVHPGSLLAEFVDGTMTTCVAELTMTCVCAGVPQPPCSPWSTSLCHLRREPLVLMLRSTDEGHRQSMPARGAWRQCSALVDDLVHCLSDCPAYTDLRVQWCLLWTDH